MLSSKYKRKTTCLNNSMLFSYGYIDTIFSARIVVYNVYVFQRIITKLIINICRFHKIDDFVDKHLTLQYTFSVFSRSRFQFLFFFLSQ